MHITADQIHRLAHQSRPEIAAMIADRAEEVLPARGITTRPVACIFLANVCVESAYFTTLEENLNYSAQRAREVWPSHFPSITSAQKVAHNPQALARVVYGGRMGNTGPDDGYIFRGEGLIQTTGKSNSERLAKAFNTTLDEARRMLTDPAHALDCAAMTFSLVGALAAARAGSLEATIHCIRGACTNHDLAERGALYHKALSIFTN